MSGCCSIEIELMSKNEEAPSRVTVHTIQLPPLMSFSTKETRHTVKIKPNGSSTIIVPLTVECVYVYILSVCLSVRPCMCVSFMSS